MRYERKENLEIKGEVYARDKFFGALYFNFFSV